MWWFNLLAGAASLLGLGLSVWALVTARDARKRVAAFERHEEAVASLKPHARAAAEVRERRSSRGRVLPRGRCDDLSDALGELLAADAIPPGPSRECVRAVLRKLRQPEIVNGTEAQSWLRELGPHLATIEAHARSRARKPLRP